MRRAVVTGGARGLGAASAERLRADGVEVVTIDLAGDVDVRLDITDENALAEAAASIGAVDILINSAGIVGPNKPLLETTTGRVVVGARRQRAGYHCDHPGVRSGHD